MADFVNPHKVVPPMLSNIYSLQHNAVTPMLSNLYSLQCNHLCNHSMHDHNKKQKPPIFCAFAQPLCVVRIEKDKKIKIKKPKEERKDQWLT
jgi:hypothetical protein